MKRNTFAPIIAAPFLMLAWSWAAQADSSAPTTCADGTTSSATGRGACSGHGGVQKAATPSTTTGTAAPPASAAPAASAPTNCKDGTTSTATGRGACSGHGGVQKA